MNLYVKSITGMDIYLHVQRADTVGEIKVRINEKLGYPADEEMVLYECGKKLNDSIKMYKCEIEMGSSFCFVQNNVDVSSSKAKDDMSSE